MSMFTYWRQTLAGLAELAWDALAWDAFDATCVCLGEKALAWWDRTHPGANDLDLADLLADIEAETEVHEPDWFRRTPKSEALLEVERAMLCLESLSELIEKYLPEPEKP